jgi:hypothetical protein
MTKLFARVAVAAGLLLCAAGAFAQGNGNAPTVAVPALGGIGLATLAGGLAMAGAWTMARTRRKQ